MCISEQLERQVAIYAVT